MSYPGNSSLAADIQERILTTYKQTLDLAAKGDQRHALVGCDFILRLDPLFEPANRLKVRLEESDGAVAIDDLVIAADSPTVDDVFDFEENSQPAAGTPPAQEAPEVARDLPTVEPEEAIPGLMISPAARGPVEHSEDEDAAEDPAIFSDIDADELEAALDLGALNDDGQPAEVAPVQVITGPSDSSERDSRVALDAADDEDDPETEESSELRFASEPTAALDAESEQRIQDLLKEGQGAFETGEYQSAIDAWSRIFLIDIDHAEASRRIELARKLKAEVERQVEEQYHEALAQVDAGDLEAATQGFTKVLEMQSSHLAAQEYLDKLATGTLDATDEPVMPPPPVPRPAALSVPDESPSELDSIPGGGLEIPADLGQQLESVPLPRSERKARPAARTRKTAGVRKSFLYVGGAVLILALGIGWLLYSNFDDTFPNAGQGAAATPQPRVDVIARAQQVHEEGNAALAIAQLKRLPPNHPRYAEAQALIAQWEAPSAEDAEPQEPVSEDVIAERDRLVAGAQGAFDRREFLLSHELLTRAAAVSELDATALQLQTAAALELQPLRSEIEIFRQGEWSEVLRSLWQIRESDPDNPDIKRLMVDSYYNLGVRDLQRRDPLSAAQNLREALDISDGDEEVARVLRFAETYQQRPVDLLYRIFVKYLPFR